MRFTNFIKLQKLPILYETSAGNTGRSVGNHLYMDRLRKLFLTDAKSKETQINFNIIYYKLVAPYTQT